MNVFPPSLNSRIVGYIQLLLGAAIFGTSGPLLKSLEAPLLILVFFRLLGASPIPGGAFPVHKWKERSREELRLLSASSVLSIIRIPLWVYAFQHAPVSHVILILLTWPSIAALCSSFLFRLRPHAHEVLAFFVAMAGVCCVSLSHTVDHEDARSSVQLLPLLAMGLSALCAGLNAALCRKLLYSIPSPEVLFFSNFWGAFLFASLVLIYEGTRFIDITFLPQLLLCLSYGLWIGLVGQGLAFAGMKKHSPSVGFLTQYLELFIGSLLGIMVLQEPVSLPLLAGMALIVVSLWVGRPRARLSLVD